MPSLTNTLEDAIHRAIGFANARRHELATLDALAEQVMAAIQDVPGITDVRPSREGGVPQELVRIDGSDDRRIEHVEDTPVLRLRDMQILYALTERKPSLLRTLAAVLDCTFDREAGAPGMKAALRRIGGQKVVQ